MSDNIERSLGKIEGLLESLNESMKTHMAADEAKFEKADVRLKSLENSRAWTIGVGAGVSALIAGIVSIFKG